MRQFYTIFYTKNVFSSCCYIKANFKNNEIYQIFFRERAVRKWGSVILIHPMAYKPQFFTDIVSQCLNDKYEITYQSILGEGVVRPHLVASNYCKILRPLKGTSSLNHFLHKKYF